MRSKFWIYAWKGGYLQAEGLADGLPGLIILRQNSRYQHRAGDVVINWGSSECPPMLRDDQLINRPSKLGLGKRKQFDTFKAAGLRTVTYTNNRDTAVGWLRDGKVLGRNRDHGMGGEGITVYQPGEALGKHLYYCKYVKKEREIRVHVLNGKVIFRQEKLKKNGAENADKYIRSHGRGWCFAFKHFGERPVPAGCDEAGIAAVRALGLDFGGVDIGWSEQSGTTVFEVNSAPGIEETSLKAYVEAFRGL